MIITAILSTQGLRRDPAFEGNIIPEAPAKTKATGELKSTNDFGLKTKYF